jgi:hypothetical protein
MNKMTKTKAWEIVGGLSAPSKMPETSYGLSALRCPTGSALAKIPGTVCFDCYALKGRYAMPTVSDAHARRQAALDRALTNENGEWWEYLSAWVTLLSGVKHHRWHDSGDIQSAAHLYMITSIALATPDTKHWLPTKETGIVKDYTKEWGSFPSNLTVRISASKIDKVYGSSGPTSMVYSTDEAVPATAHKCPIYSDPALKAANCADVGCFACWNNNVKTVAYPQH